MPEEPLNNSISSATPENNSPSSPEPSPEPSGRSLRETIEQAYEAPAETSSGQDTRQRDSNGRFIASDRDETGVAEPKAPSPEKKIVEAQRPANEPAPTVGSSTQVPEHWSAELKADFSKLQPEGQAILLNRHREMEADYTRKLQAASGAVSFTQSLAPVFNDPVVAGTLQKSGIDASQAIQQWGADIKQAASPNVQDRINLLVDLTQRMGLDPARLFVTAPPPQISNDDWKDPAVRYFADHLGRTTSDIQALRAELQGMRQAEVQQRERETIEATEWGINQFGDEKGANGQPLRPYFDRVMPGIIELFTANPGRDLQDAYERACWADPEVRRLLQAAERQQTQNQNSVNHAKMAQRSNTRGLTSPVAKPSAQAGNGTLRGILASSADEVGF